MAAYATTQELQDWLGNEWTVADDEKRAERLLRMASALVRRYTKKVWTDEPAPDDVKDVVCAAAGRSFTNPNAETRSSIDDFQYGQKVDEAGLYFTESEVMILEDYAKPAFGGLGTISTERGDINTGQDDQSWWVNGPNGWTE